MRKNHTVHVHAAAEDFGHVSLTKKYLGYLSRASRVKHGHNLILSERFSFLLLALQRDQTVVVCHDLVTLLNSRASWPHTQWYRVQLRYMARAKSIICISENTRKDLLQFCPFIASDKIKVVYNGIEKFWFDDTPAQTDVMREKIPGKKFFLMVGTDAWNKNFGAVISALQIFQQPDFVLVKIGGLSGMHQAELRGAGLQLQVIHIPEVADEELKWFYKNTEALIFPSLHEGFGWPVLEAMACGCAVIASHASSVPEVAGGAAVYVDPHKPEDIAEAMNKIMNNSKLKAELRILGKKQASAFSWEATADKIVQVLKD